MFMVVVHAVVTVDRAEFTCSVRSCSVCSGTVVLYLHVLPNIVYCACNRFHFQYTLRYTYTPTHIHMQLHHYFLCTLAMMYTITNT